MTTLSAIVPTYERPEAVADTVEDLLRQTRLPNEVIVLDQSDAAPSSGLSAARRAWPATVRWFGNLAPNAQAARNRGIREARGRILLLLDDDVRLPPDFVARHLANYEADPTIDGVAGQVLEPGQQPTDELPPTCAWPANGWMFLPLNYARRTPAVNWPSCNGSVRKEVAVRVGGFDERYTRTWWDDSDFSWRLHRAGAKVVFDPSATLLHLRVPSGGRRPGGPNPHVWRDAEAWAGMFYFWRKNFGLRPVWRHVWWWVRHMIGRRALLARPYWLARNLDELAAGYRLATRRLRAGPIYLREGGVA